jgi:uncharacterized protein YjiS (DUF1127 family)
MSSTVIDFPAPAAKPVQSWLAFLAGTTRRGIAQIGKIGRIHRDTAALYELDDRMLADIGLCRGDVEYAVRHGRRPSDGSAGADR